MKFLGTLITATVLIIGGGIPTAVHAQGGQMVKLCLFYARPSGHARSDPIVNQACPSAHVHTFYGPLDFHPNTGYEDLIKAVNTPELSTSPFVENQSLYWHPSIYQVVDNGDGTETYTRLSNLDSSPYYRWDKSATPLVEAFPPQFRMIAGTDDPGANQGGETGQNMLTECCDIVAGQEVGCTTWPELNFPDRACSFLGIAFLMPTCWNGELGITGNHRDHMAFTTDGTVAGPCPNGYTRRLPQVQLFVRINNYRGDIYRYQLSDGNRGGGNGNVWHVDFFNGWQEGKLQEIIDGCDFYPDQEVGDFNPPCDCTGGSDEIGQVFLTPVANVAQSVCDQDVRRLIIDEATDVVTGPSGTNVLPSGMCNGPSVIPKSWDTLSADLFPCQGGPPEPPEPPKGGLPVPLCFSAFNLVEVQGSGFIPMDKLKIGDFVKAGEGQYSRVHGFYHLERSTEAVFLQVKINGSDNPLEISEKHLTFVNGTAIPAASILVGDNLGGAIVESITRVKRRGIFAPATYSGDIMVSGVLVSTYSSHLPYSPLDEHIGAHLLLSYHRLICRISFEMCESETYSDSGVSQFMTPLLPFARVGEWSAPAQFAAIALAFPVSVLVWILEQLLLSGFTFFIFVIGLYLRKENAHSKPLGP